MKVKVHDPMALGNFKKKFGNQVVYCSTIKDCITKSDCCIILTEWDSYKKLKALEIKKLMNKPNIIDARRVLNPKQFSKVNFHAIGLGS